MGAVRKGSTGEFILSWILALYWVHIVHSFSGGSFSAEETSRFIGPLLEWLFPEASETTRYLLHKGIRKLAHLVEYGILAGFSFRALSLSAAREPFRVARLAAGLVLVIALIDEAGQAQTAVRTGSSRDVVIDFAGGAAVLWLLCRVKLTPRAHWRWIRLLAGDA